MKGFIEFIRSQGAIGLAVGFILGKAVSDLVGSIVNDLINPLLGLLLGNLGDLSSWSLQVASANVAYGKFITVAINFIVIAAVVYFGVKRLGFDRLDKPKQ